MDRWAVVVKETGVVSDIKIMEGVPPELNADKADKYDVFKSETLQIGMVRGGKVRAVDGFGFADELSAAGLSETGVTRLADASAKSSDKEPASSHEKVRHGQADAAKSSGDGENAIAERGTAKRSAARTSTKRKAARTTTARTAKGKKAA